MGQGPLDEKTLKRWREAALSGDFSRMKGMLNEMIARDWPEHDGHVFIHEYGRGELVSENEPDKEKREQLLADHHNRELDSVADGYGDFVSDLYSRRYAAATDNISGTRLRLRQEASSYARQDLETEFSSSGFTTRQDFLPDAEGAPERRIGVVQFGMNVSTCQSCDTARSVRRAEKTCAAVTPDTAMSERFDLFQTGMHELGHAMRNLDGKLFYQTPAEKRYEEGIARVFEGMMGAWLLGEPGLIAMNLQRGNYLFRFNGDFESQDLAYEYDAASPMRAALDFIRQDPDGFRRMRPRELLDKAEELVQDHDRAAALTPPQQVYYKLNIARPLPGSFNDLAERVREWDDPQARVGRLALHSPPPTGTHVDVRPAVEALAAAERTVFEQAILSEPLTRRFFEINPLRPPPMQKANAYDPKEGNNPDLLKVFDEYNRKHNPPNCKAARPGRDAPLPASLAPSSRFADSGEETEPEKKVQRNWLAPPSQR